VILRPDGAIGQRGDDKLVELVEPVLVVMKGTPEELPGMESVFAHELLVTNP
jgi:hypothetical protein